MPATLITGATGFLGSALVAALLERGEDDVVALVRARDDEAAAVRMDEALARVYGDAPPPNRHRLTAVAGDLERPLPPIDAELATIVHCGASITFDLPLAQARAINVDGTLRILDLAAARGARLVHVSTAYVSGEREGVFREDELDLGASFRNTYERTKAVAEREVAGSGVASAVARPSIVVGDSSTGWTTAFNVLYFPLRAFARGLLDVVPADPDGIIDAIAVDVVVAGLLALHDDAGAAGTYTLAAGPAAVTVDAFASAAADLVGRPRTRFAPVDVTETAGDGAAVYLPYFNVRTRFGVDRGHALLADAGATVEPVTAYLPALLGFAEASKWGKKTLTRAAAR